VIVGIGINLTNAVLPRELESVATSVEAATKREPDMEFVIETLQRCFMTRYQAMKSPTGPSEVVREWSQRSSYASGKRVTVSESDDGFAGTTRGLEPDGALRVETETGEIKIVRAGDVSVRAVVS
jgi:BirA family biotin operon repressor/biotin-[acetyl-CoA-carboxylase] ligase